MLLLKGDVMWAAAESWWVCTLQVGLLQRELDETTAELHRATRLLKLADPDGYFRHEHHPQSMCQRIAKRQKIGI